MSVIKEILQQLEKRNIKDQASFNKLKLEIIRKHRGEKIPNNIEIANEATESQRKRFRNILSIKPTRTISGVAPIAIMTKPIKCPHGACLMCPSYTEKGVPQSYTGKEPAALRAARNNFDPYLQIFNRLEQYLVMNQFPEKVEIIIMGGTFPSFPKKYKNDFIYYTFKALNDFSKLFFPKNKFNLKYFLKFFELPGAVKDEKRTKSIQNKILKLKNKNKKILQKEQTINESAKIKCIGLTIETRPDYATLRYANELLKFGCTRVELGIQSIYPEVLEKIQRGHTVEQSIESTKILKDLGFKINYHYMPGLFVNKTKDLDGLKELFKNQNFRPDMLKIYPCMVVKGSKLYKLWKKGLFKPLTTKKAASLIAEFKKTVPEYCRIMRVQRDIPTYATEAGVDRTNLRQYIEQLMKKRRIKCRCIRCREIGHQKKPVKLNPEIITRHYPASDGNEFFISYEDKDILLGFCRLRFPSSSLRKEITNDSAIIRELHVFGELTQIGKKGKTQHKGIGKLLLKEAEATAKTYNKEKIIVISGVGARNYYKKFGYKKQGPYMVKSICS
ncbi:tRNA uridine(34) 5-carboxymethylaminomethyl modification radical SAM/GNAT enzyme Elp3 [Candidatus Woesearchaeota archaeon]|nr:tRNA uridine(34) 5-carboxymethylaminomethyl modification radical SAM/GNAT enzyme Elp3 [Candidatus Woesearchaeota archaeon]